jgi:succinyl-diaminopimelate desuccinylase
MRLHMRASKLFENIESSRKEVVELSSELVKIPTPNPPGDTEQCAKFIEEYFKKHGIPTKIYQRTKGKANVSARVEGKNPRTILWLGHIDVVPEGNPESWRYRPYSGEVDGGFIYGRGSSDMKGNCAAAMVAAKTLSEAGQPPYNVDFWFTCDEEIGGRDGAEWLSKDKIIRGDVCIIGDSSTTPSKPYIDIGCKGMLWTRLRAKGVTAHGSQPYLGDNAVEKLLTIAPQIKKMSNYRLDVPRELRPALRSSVNYLLSAQKLTEEQQKATRRLYDYPTVALNVLDGGVKINVVPDAAEASFDIRLTPGIDFDKMKKHLLQLIEDSGVKGITVDFVQTGTGYYESTRSQFAKQLSKAIKMVTGARPTFKVLTGGTDAISLKNYCGIQCLGFGAGLEGQAHAPNEHVPIQDLVMAAKAYAVFPLVYRP